MKPNTLRAIYTNVRVSLTDSLHEVYREVMSNVVAR